MRSRHASLIPSEVYDRRPAVISNRGGPPSGQTDRRRGEDIPPGLALPNQAPLRQNAGENPGVGDRLRRRERWHLKLGRRAEGFALVGARGWLGVTEPPTMPPRVGGFLLASRLVDPVAQPRWSAHRRRPHVVHRPAFLTVPEIDDEDRLAAAVVHPNDSHRGASCQGQGLCWGRSSWRGNAHHDFLHPVNWSGSAPTTTAGAKRQPQSCGTMSPAGLVRGLDPPPNGPPVMAGPTFLFCACVASAVWARLSGAARFSATEPVTGGRPSVSTNERCPAR